MGLLRWFGSSVLCLPLVLGACASENPPSDLASRLDWNLSNGITARQATVERLPDGARVTFPETALFPGAGSGLSPQGEYRVVSVVESLLAPAIMQVQVVGDPSVPEYLRADQVRRVQQYFPAETERVPMAAGNPGTSPGSFTILLGVRPDWAQRVETYHH